VAEIVSKGKGKWLVRVFLGRSAGRTKYHNKLVHGTKKDARKYAREAETQRDLGTLIKASSEDVTLDKFLDGWLCEFKKGSVKERTYEGYVFILDNYVRPRLGKNRLTELTARTIQAAYNDLSEAGYSPRTVAFAHSLLKEALNQAVVDDLLPANPATPTRRPARVKRAIDVFTPEEAERFMKAAKSDPMGVVFWFALAVGARPEEYTALQWSDVDLNKCEVTFHRSVWWPAGGGWRIEEVKTQASLRTVNFSPVLATALLRHRRTQSARRLKLGKKYHNHDLVFASRIGTPMTFKNLTRRHLGPILINAKIEGRVHLYRLRHSFATLSLLAGADAKSVSRAMGHSSVWFTQDTYQHVLPAMRRDAAEKIGRMLFGSV
jgi:integrase